MSGFVIVDLESQADAVSEFVAGWSKADFLAWLSQYGEVIAVTHPGEEVDRYSFHSPSGPWAGFWFNKDGTLHLWARLGRSAVYPIKVQMSERYYLPDQVLP